MPQAKRTETLDRFKKGEFRLLVASDVAARGLDIQGLSHVFNFDVPIHAEDYVHRIGRTGRAGREGRAFTLAAPEDGRFVAAIQKLIDREIPVVAVDGIATASLEFDERSARSRFARSADRAERPRARPDRGRSERGHAERGHGERSRARHAAEERPARYGERRDARDGAPRAPRPDERQPDTHESPRRATPAAPAEKFVAPFAAAAAARPTRPPRSEPIEDRATVGFGDHLPAFLARPPRVAAP
jgi:superfamily II DNA/RNA helicase